MAYVAGDPEKIAEGVGRMRAAVQRARSCCCARCRCRGLTGPVVLITLGVLFMLNEFGVAGFERTWPILLICIGLVQILVRSADTTGHVDIFAPPPAPPATGPQSSEPGQVNHV